MTTLITTNLHRPWTYDECRSFVAQHGHGSDMWCQFSSYADVFVLADYEKTETLLQRASEEKMISLYKERFINRLDRYAVQKILKGGSCEYSYRNIKHEWFDSKPENWIRRHLEGKQTISLPSVDLQGNCKWCVWDSDNEDGNIVRLQAMLDQLGFYSYRESVRPGRDGHLWIFFDTPVNAQDLIDFNTELLSQLAIPADRIEFFPKYSDGRLSQLRAPLGINKKPSANNARGYFEGGGDSVISQLKFTVELKESSGDNIHRIASLVRSSKRQIVRPSFLPRNQTTDFKQTNFLTAIPDLRRRGVEYVGQCPLCLQEGHDKHRDNLRVSADGLKMTCVFQGCNVTHKTSDICKAYGL